MPVTIRQETTITPEVTHSVKRVLHDIPSTYYGHSVVQQWLDSSTTLELWVAVFNDRIIGFALMSGCEIKAFVVHGATRGRGVGKRMLILLAQKCGSINIQPSSPDTWLRHQLDRLENA